MMISVLKTENFFVEVFLMKKTFRKTIVLLLAAVIALSACLCGCSGNVKGFPVGLSDTTRSALEICATAHKDHELEDIYRYVKEGNSIGDLNSKYPIECLRSYGDDYAVIYKGNYKVLVLRFDKDANWIEKDKLQCLYRVTFTRGVFDDLSVGDDVTKVQTADPTCFFPFLVTGYQGELVTHHYTDDGYHTTITYNDDLTIQSSDYEVM